ncbi:hypothetical protein WJX77_001678 [Trebouxia sp. C0004]
MSQQPHQLPYDFSGVDSNASLYQASQTTPSFAWQQPQSGPIPYVAAAGSLAYGDADSVSGQSQSRVEDWASQAVAATLQQGMSETHSEVSGQPVPVQLAHQPASPAHSTSSQQTLQFQQQQLLQQQQQQLQQQQQQQLQQQQHQQLLQQHQLLQQQQHQQVQPGLLGQIPGLGSQYSQQQLHGTFMGQQPFASQAMGGMTGQLPAFSEGMATSGALGQGNGMLPKPSAQQLKQSMIGQIPAGPGSQAGAKQQLDGSASSIPALPGFGMVGQMPEHALNPRLVGQLPPQSMYQQPVSFGFQQHLLGQQLNLPFASTGMSLPPHNQFGFGQQFGLFPNALQRPGPLVAGSHVGSIDGSVYNLPDSASVMSRTSAAQPTTNPPVVSLASLSTQQKVKMLCSSGGHFTRVPGGWEYQGGETRLVSVSNYCHMQELQDALHRVSQTMRLDLSSSSASMSNTKYQLPGSSNLYVDLIDDEDVKLMFDEWADYITEEGRASRNAKLHIYMDWQAKNHAEAGMPSGGHHAGLDTISDTASADTPVARAPPPPSMEMRGSIEPSLAEESPLGQSGSAGSAPNEPRESEFSLQRIASTMEIIDPRDITLVKFLGSGGYGEVHLGKWHSSEAAIKCLNPSLFFQGGDAGGQAAISELIKEATLLSSMRHPNVVWVYGIVLKPMSKDEDEDDDELSDRDPGDAVELAAALARQPQTGGAGVVRPPAIVVEYMGQGSLKGALARKADIVQGALIRLLIAMDAAKGMEYLHTKRIVHFDLKSANLLLGYKDRRAICKVADFGLSKQKRDTYVSNVSSQRGTLPWIAPEIIKTPHAVTEKVDVYSFGVVLWELWTGREPYDGLNYHALLHQITTSKGLVRPPMPNSPEWEHSPLPELVSGYKELIESCWEENPSKRPTFREIVSTLKSMAQGLRPPPKRRPSQISTQTSAISSLSSCKAPSSQPNGPQLPNISE